MFDASRRLSVERPFRSLEEAVSVDDHPLMGSIGRNLVAFANPVFEENPLPLDCSHFGSGRHCSAEMSRLDMMNLGVDSDRGLVLLEYVPESCNGGLLRQRQHPRCGQHGHVTRAVRHGGVRFSHHEGNFSAGSRFDHGVTIAATAFATVARSEEVADW